MAEDKSTLALIKINSRLSDTIQDLSNEMSMNSNALENFTKNLNTLSKNLDKPANKESNKTMVSIKDVFTTLFGRKIDKKNAEDVLSVLDKTYKIANSWDSVSDKAMNNMKTFSEQTNNFFKISEIDEKKRKNVENIGTSLFKFSTVMSLTTPFLLVATPAILLFSKTSKYISDAFTTLSDKKVVEGAKNLGFVSLSLAGLALGFASYAFLSASDVSLGLVAVGGIASVFYLLNRLDSGNNVEKGAIAIGLTGVSLIALSLGLGSFTKLPLESITNGLLATTGVATIFGLAGIPAVAMAIGLGSLVLGLAAGSLYVLSKSFETFSQIKWTDENSNSLKNAFVSILSPLTSINPIALTGAALLFPLYTMAGISLSTMSIGLKSFKSTKFTEQDSKSLYTTITAINAAFSTAGGGGNTGSVLSFLTGVDLSPTNVERGISSVLDAGDALTSISDGLISWNRIYKNNFTKSDFVLGGDGLPIQGTVLGNIYSVSTVIQSIFGKIGKSANNGKSLSSFIFGGDFAESDVEQGIESINGIGKTLSDLANGISSWKKLESVGMSKSDLIIKDGLPIQGTVLGNIYSVLTVTKDIFAQIGKSGQKQSLVSMLFGGDFGESDVEQGVESIKNTGKTLIDLADGLKKWKSLESVGLSKNDLQLSSNGLPIQGTVLGNIYSVSTAVSNIFAKIGKSVQGTSLTSMIFGGDFGESDVEQGVEGIKNSGKILSDLADGLKKWKSLESVGFSSKDFSIDSKGLPIQGTVLGNIYSILTVSGNVFAKIGKRSGNWIFDGIDDGIATVKKSADALNAVSTTILKYKDIKDVSLISNNIVELTSALPKAVARSMYIMKQHGIDEEDARDFFEGSFKSGLGRMKDFAEIWGKISNAKSEPLKIMTESFTKILKETDKQMSGESSVGKFVRFVNAVKELAKLDKSLNSVAKSIDNLSSSMSNAGNYTPSLQPYSFYKQETPSTYISTPTTTQNSDIGKIIDNNEKTISEIKDKVDNKKIDNQTALYETMSQLSTQMNIMIELTGKLINQNETEIGILRNGIKVKSGSL